MDWKISTHQAKHHFIQTTRSTCSQLGYNIVCLENFQFNYSSSSAKMQLIVYSRKSRWKYNFTGFLQNSFLCPKFHSYSLPSHVHSLITCNPLSVHCSKLMQWVQLLFLNWIRADVGPSKCIRESLSETSKVIIVWVTSTIWPLMWCTFGVGNYLITDHQYS